MNGKQRQQQEQQGLVQAGDDLRELHCSMASVPAVSQLLSVMEVTVPAWPLLHTHRRPLPRHRRWGFNLQAAHPSFWSTCMSELTATAAEASCLASSALKSLASVLLLLNASPVECCQCEFQAARGAIHSLCLLAKSTSSVCTDPTPHAPPTVCAGLVLGPGAHRLRLLCGFGTCESMTRLDCPPP